MTTGDPSAQGGFSHSHLCRHRATTWYPVGDIQTVVRRQASTSLHHPRRRRRTSIAHPPALSVSNRRRVCRRACPLSRGSREDTCRPRRFADRRCAPLESRRAFSRAPVPDTGSPSARRRSSRFSPVPPTAGFSRHSRRDTRCGCTRKRFRYSPSRWYLTAGTTSSSRSHPRGTRASLNKREGDGPPGLLEDAAASSSSATTWMYMLLDEDADLLSASSSNGDGSEHGGANGSGSGGGDGGGGGGGDDVVENDATMVADNGACMNDNDRLLHYHHHHHQHHLQHHRHCYHRELQQQQQQQQPPSPSSLPRQQQRHSSESPGLDDLLRFRDPAITTAAGQKIVAQEMAQGYTQLLHAGQKLQDFMSLDGLQPRVHQEHHRDICTASPAAELYQHHQPQQQGNQQQQTLSYYNLTTVQESSCSTVYFSEIDTGSGVGELTAASAGGGEGLAPTPTPASSGNGTATPNSPSATTTTTGTTTTAASTATSTSTVTIPRVATGAEPPRHMETPPTMVPDQAPASGHQYHHHHHHHHHQRHHRSASNVSGHGPATEPSEEFAPVSRKRKLSCHVGSDLLDDLGEDVKSVRTNDDNKKQNHSEIEKRRRDKMNTYITELSAMVPMCHAMSRKLDKLTVLRMAVQHLKTILGAVTSYTEGHYKPAFLSDQELKTLILQAAEGFVFVVGCDRGRILYVSESVSQTLNYSQSDLLGQSWFDILHPKDVAKVKEQLSSSDLSPKERLIDAKTMLPVKTDVPQGVSRLCPGARRSFFCRMKRKVDGVRSGEMQVKEEADATSGSHRRKKQQNVDWKYCVIQCTGYLKSWTPAKIGLEEQESEADGEACNLSCLVAVGRIQMAISTSVLTSRKPHLRPIQFVSRHAMNGKFLFVDQRATPVLGFLPQELLGTSMYEYYHHGDIPHLAESHKAALQTSERVTTQIYRFRSKDANFVRLQSEWKSFKNPWTKDIEYLIAKNSVIIGDTCPGGNNEISEDSSVQGNYDYFTQSNGGLERLISSHVEVSKIGRQITEEVLNLQRRGENSSSGSSPGPVTESSLLNTEMQIATTASPERIPEISQQGIGSDSSSNPTSTFNHVANNVQLNSIANDQGASPNGDMIDMISGTAINESSNPIPSDGNDEAAMAVIMSLLEADAGLGGPVDFSGLPWPLP